MLAVWHRPLFVSCYMLHNLLHCSSVLLCPSAHRQIICVGLLPFVSKKFELIWETITFSVEIVEWNEREPSGLVMEICCLGVYTFLVTLVFEQVQCPESMNRNTFPCFHPDPEPYSPQPLLSHTRKGSALQTPELNLFYRSETDLGVWWCSTDRQKNWTKNDKREPVWHPVCCCWSPSGCLQPFAFFVQLLDLFYSLLCSSLPQSFPLYLFLLFIPSLILHLCFPASLTLSTHFPFRRLRITAAPQREVCENAQCRSPGMPTPGAECEKRALHLMPDWPNLLPDSWAFLFPAARQERGQKWCRRRGEGTVIVSRSVEIPHPRPP